MTYSIPIDFEYSTISQQLNQSQKTQLRLPPKTILRVFGTVGSGKGTVSMRLADFFDISTVDSGKIWRAATYGYTQEKLANTKENTDLVFSKIEAKLVKDDFELYYNEQKLTTDQLRNPEVDALVSTYSVHRDAYNTFLINFLKQNNHSLVLDGRGGKTPYLIEAENSGYHVIKLFLFVSLDAAAYRRALDYQAKNTELSFEELLQKTKDTIVLRDQNDYNHIIDQNMGWVDETTFALETTELTIDEVFETALFLIYQSTR
jgi:cytidylate kinase